MLYYQALKLFSTILIKLKKFVNTAFSSFPCLYDSKKTFFKGNFLEFKEFISFSVSEAKLLQSLGR